MRDTLEVVVLRFLKNEEHLYCGGKGEITCRAIAPLEKHRGTYPKPFKHQSISGCLSTLQTSRITQSNEERWTLTSDWESRLKWRDEQIAARAVVLEKVKQAFRGRLKEITERPEVKAENDGIEGEVDDILENEIDISKGKKQRAEDLRESATRAHCFRVHGRGAWFTGETEAVQAGHIIDVDCFKDVGVDKADNSPWNTHPISPNMNAWERQGLVRLLPTVSGVKLHVDERCTDPKILKYHGREEIIADDVLREQIHIRIAIKNEYTETMRRIQTEQQAQAANSSGD
jgi:hypothetical protein